MAKQLKWSVWFKPSEGNDKNWHCHMDGVGAMPAIPAKGDIVEGSWLSDGSSNGLSGSAKVVGVKYHPADPGPRGELRMDVVVLLKRERVRASAPRKKKAARRTARR